MHRKYLFSNGSEKWYLVRYLTTYHAPLQPKDPDHVSDTKKKNHFIDDLLLSKEDIQQIKKYNLFTLGE